MSTNYIKNIDHSKFHITEEYGIDCMILAHGLENRYKDMDPEEFKAKVLAMFDQEYESEVRSIEMDFEYIVSEMLELKYLNTDHFDYHYYEMFMMNYCSFISNIRSSPIDMLEKVLSDENIDIMYKNAIESVKNTMRLLHEHKSIKFPQKIEWSIDDLQNESFIETFYEEHCTSKYLCKYFEYKNKAGEFIYA